jgi:hypothetical protein
MGSNVREFSAVPIKLFVGYTESFDFLKLMTAVDHRS